MNRKQLMSLLRPFAQPRAVLGDGPETTFDRQKFGVALDEAGRMIRADLRLTIRMTVSVFVVALVAMLVTSATVASPIFVGASFAGGATVAITCVMRAIEISRLRFCVNFLLAAASTGLGDDALAAMTKLCMDTFSRKQPLFPLPLQKPG